ncbi:hypothetical protein WJX73_007575 [Symbiochloris irregularis]|uniref:Metallo-beta-lactamase domain-containing protein n=1 Tax=Symbiochloris irregularis TaxID=706552 RepID=A0AAW1NWA3_9CHLO
MVEEGYHSTIKEEAPNVWSFGIEPKFGIGQRSWVLQSGKGAVMWDCVPLLDEKAVQKIRELGGLQAITASHPHFFSAMVDWAELFDTKIFLPETARPWADQCRNDARITFWPGNKHELADRVTILRLGGHFRSSSVLHWDNPDLGGALFTGDTVFATPDPRWVSWMYSFPELLPLPAREVARIRDALKPWKFQRLYAAFTSIEQDADEVVQRSAGRYIAHVSGTAGIEYT